MKKNVTKQYRYHIVRQGSLGMLIILALLLVACGGATSSESFGPSVNAPAHQVANTSSQGSGSSSGQTSKSSTSFGPQYLIKSLQVNMLVKDTRQVASDLQSWITTTDPRSTSAAIDYEQTYDNLYNVTMTFSVTSAQYTQIEEYLAGYAQQRGGKLTSLHESVQDVTNDYIDTQSRLTNLRGEQQRLLTLLSNTTALGDIITVESKLTDVEGQIEDIEAHLNALKNQTTFYTVTIGLQPITPITSPPLSSPPWSLGQVLHDSWTAALGFGQGLATLLIWLVVFSIYLVPVALVGWFVWRRMHSRQALTSPAIDTGSSQTEP